MDLTKEVPNELLFGTLFFILIITFFLVFLIKKNSHKYNKDIK